MKLWLNSQPYVQSNSDSDLQFEKQEESSRPLNKQLHEELIVQVVVHLKEQTMEHMWFYLELISKSITQNHLLTDGNLSSRSFDDLAKLCEIICGEICTLHASNKGARAARLNSVFGFFCRDLIGILSAEQMMRMIMIYSWG